MRLARLLGMSLFGLLLVTLSAFAENAGPGGPPPTCQQRCGAQAEAVYEQCQEAKGTECYGQAQAAYQTCVAQNCTTPPPPPPTCADRCAAAADLEQQKCLSNGESADVCTAVGTATLNFCNLQLCNEGAGSCEDKCTLYGNLFYAHCLVEGGTADQCGPPTR